ncbi:MAG: hypothetical protein WC966_05240 [Bradymonadales bacterium]|jgi:hypothetical protein
MKLYSFILTILVGLLPSFAYANSKSETLAFDIQIIHAQESKEALISDGLELFEEDFSSAFSDFNHFTLLQNSYHRATAKQPAALLIPSDPPARLLISYLGRADKDAYNIEISVDAKVIAKLKLTRGATFFQAGIPYQDGILIVAITLAKAGS